MNAIIFKPIYKERVWGGRHIEDALGRTLPEGATIGESWEIVDRPEACSMVADGPLIGLTLSEIIKEDAESIMGPNWDPKKPFPILVKWLDCQDRLSLQVHPPEAVAAKTGGEPKTENWYIAEAKADASLLVGLKKGISKDKFREKLEVNELEECVHSIQTSKGDSLFVPSGRIHAIGAGNLILEIQQNSDTTYRIYDWGRVGLDGKPRDLQVEASLKSIDFDDFEPEAIKASSEECVTLVESDVFHLKKYKLNGSTTEIDLEEDQEPRIVSVVEGKVIINGDIYERGTNLLLPYSGDFKIISWEPATVLITDHFA